MTGYDRRKYDAFRRWLAVIAGLSAALAAVWQLRTAAAAIFRTEDAIHIEPGSIENSTLAIGTHLIYLHSLNEEIYAIALDSASASGQSRRYYKSELAGGMWLDISDAGSIEDITSAGKIVDESEIRGLYFTHHTKSDGITYSFETNAPVCIFDISDVYDLEYMPELEALKMQYDMMRESGSSTKTMVHNRNFVRDFFASQVQSDMTDRCDAQLQALQGYYNELAANGADSRETQTVLRVMEKVDYARRAAVLATVDSRLSSLQEDIADVTDSDGELELDDSLLTAIGDSRYAAAESLTEAQGSMLAKGSTVLSETEYTLSESMIANAEGTNYSGCDEQNQKLQYLDNISSGRIVSRQEEFVFLDELIDAADVKYGIGLSGGVTQQYTTLVSQDVSHAALRRRMQEDMADANAARSELQFLIQAKVDRQEAEEARKYILLRIQDAAKFRTVIRTDDYQRSYQDGVDAYVDWLNSLLSNIREEDVTAAEQTLYEQKADLQEQKLRALDNLDLDTAKRIDAKIADIDAKTGISEGAFEEQLTERIQQREEMQQQIAEDPQNAALQAEFSRMEAEIASLQAGIPADSQAASIMACKREILSLLAEGDTSDAAYALLESDMELLTSMLDGGSALALEASKEVYQKLLAKSELEGVNAYQGFQEQIEAAVSGSAVNTSLSGELSVQETGNVIASALGIDALLDEDGNFSLERLSSEQLSPDGLSGVPQEELAAALIALGDFGQETGAEPVQALAQGMAAALGQTGSGAVFVSKKQGEAAYVPVDILAAYLGYRYVWSDTRMNAVLSRGRYFYRFTAFRETVENEAGETIYMDSPAGFSSVLYVPQSFIEEQFDCHICDISGTEYSVLVNDSVVGRSQEILSELLERGGY